MKEIILKDYLEGYINAENLSKDVNGSEKITGLDTTNVNIEVVELEDEFDIRIEHLVKLAEDSINGKISFENIATIASALECSDYFVWDSNTVEGEKVARVLFDWDNEIISFHLTIDNLSLCIKYLKTGEYKVKI